MKNLFLLTLVFSLFISFSSAESTKIRLDPKCGTYNNKTLYRGAKGGCYYLNESNKKIYVDRGYCKC